MGATTKSGFFLAAARSTNSSKRWAASSSEMVAKETYGHGRSKRQVRPAAATQFTDEESRQKTSSPQRGACHRVAGVGKDGRAHMRVSGQLRQTPAAGSAHDERNHENHEEH